MEAETEAVVALRTDPAGAVASAHASSRAADQVVAPTPSRSSPRIVPRGAAPLPGAAAAGDAAPEPGTAGATMGAGAPVGAARRVNPFQSNDPSQKARRLARALVSDLIAYNPQRREEGLRAGNLKELFRDEIRKSWDEYVEQVGAPIAEGTTHFQDALNDVLAGGRKVF